MIRVLHLEDNPLDAELVEEELRTSGRLCEITRVATRADFLRELGDPTYDLLISDYSMPGFDGISALMLAHAQRPELPFVFISGQLGEERAVEALKQGAWDYVLKNGLGRLGPVVDRVFRDVEMKRKMARIEDKRREAEERYRAIVEDFPGVVWILDIENARMNFISQRVQDVMGFNEEEVFAGGLAFFLNRAHENDRALISQIFRSIVEGRTDEFEYRFHRKDGEWIRIAHRVVRYFEKDKRRMAFGIFEDVTEKRRAEAARIQSQKLEEIGMIAVGVAHEINNPLSYVLQNVEGALDLARGTCSCEHKAILEGLLVDVAEGAGRVREIVHDLRTFSRSESETLEAVDPAAVMEKAVRMAAPQTRPACRVISEIARLPKMLGSEGRLAQVLLNLLVNAAQAFQQPDPSRNEIRIRAAVANDRTRIEIEDNGAGIPAEKLEKIFLPFYTTKPAGQGTGLGLSVCKNIVEMFGGTISVQSRVGEGTTFTMEFPTLMAADEVTEASAGTPEGPLIPSMSRDAGIMARDSAGLCRAEAVDQAPPRRRVLMIDDETSAARAACRVLGRDHEFQAVHSGADALELLGTDRAFDVILCDLMLPDLPGMTIYERAIATCPDLAGRFVFVTGGATTKEAERFLARADIRFVEKPLNSEQLRALVEG